MSVASDAADPTTLLSEPHERPVGGASSPSRPASPDPAHFTARQRWGMAAQAAVALLLIGIAVWTSIEGLDDRDVRLHHLEHAALLCGGGLLGLLISRHLQPSGHAIDIDDRPALRIAVLGILVVEPLVLMAVMIPSTSPWIDAHPSIHALEHLLLIVLGGVLGLLGSLFSPVLGWLLVLVTAAMMAAFAGIVLPTSGTRVAHAAAIGIAATWWRRA